MSTFFETLKDFYQQAMKSNWSPVVGGIIIAFLAVLLEAWYRPWGIVGGIRNWGEWFWYAIGVIEDRPPHPIWFSSSVLNLGLVLGAFISATLAFEFGLRIPPLLEIIKGIIAGILMGIGAGLAQGCNIGAWYMSLGNLSGSGIIMMIGLFIGVFIGVKYLLWEIEHLSSSGGREISFGKLNPILGIIGIIILILGTYGYFRSEHEDGAVLGGCFILTAGIGYAIHRSRLCIVNSFREPFLSGDARMARGVALSLILLTLGVTILKMAEIKEEMLYVTPTFGLAAFLGGIIFGAAMVVAGGCGSGALWRVAEGQLKLWIVVIFFSISNAIFRHYLDNVWEVWDKGYLGKAVFLPHYFGYGISFIIIALIILIWYLLVDWNEKSEKFVIGI
ncbi:MAG: YeeE/YedE thiosulfate transporter family protein [Thermodesulfobacteriaceae bacterium]|nr:YeeE/YedE thiosulfate transporter family protein [Thermodesulfobacteriaceae bacterium]MDW8135278.1 YeeE/YedE thiosulfate transporter family protein [Thermodesulfobacterium sp.]